MLTGEIPFCKRLPTRRRAFLSAVVVPVPTRARLAARLPRLALRMAALNLGASAGRLVVCIMPCTNKHDGSDGNAITWGCAVQGIIA